MKYVHSIWSKPMISKTNNNSSVVDLDYKSFTLNFYSYMLSALLIKKHGYKIELFCDEFSYELYSKIPYDKITIVDFTKDGIDEKFWIYGKIKAHSLMNEPYVHIDGDVFLFRDIIGDNLEKYGSVVQMIENEKTITTFHDNYTKSLTPFLNLNVGIDWTKYGLVAYNCGVVGFHDMNLKNTYVKSVVKTLRGLSNSNNFQMVKNKYNGMFLISEQSLLYYILNEENKKPFEIIQYSQILKNEYNWNKIAIDIGYTHLWGYTKYNPTMIDNIKFKIKKFFNDKYYIIEEFEINNGLGKI